MPFFPTGIERAFAMLFSRSFLIVFLLQGDCCCSCLLKRNFHPDRACYLATGLPVESGTSFLRSIDDFGMCLTQPMQCIASGVAIALC